MDKPHNPSNRFCTRLVANHAMCGTLLISPACPADLKTLKYGDTVLIHAFGEVYTYEVRESRLVPPLGFNNAIDHEDDLRRFRCQHR